MTIQVMNVFGNASENYLILVVERQISAATLLEHADSYIRAGSTYKTTFDVHSTAKDGVYVEFQPGGSIPSLFYAIADVSLISRDLWVPTLSVNKFQFGKLRWL